MSKSFAICSTFIFVFGLVAISNLSTADAGVLIQEEAPAAPQEASPSDMPVTEGAVAQESVLQEAVPVPMAALQAPMMVTPVAGCNACCCAPCACPVEMTLCLVDDCDCTYEVCVTVPACCVGQAPQVSWRNGILGRKIAKLCWPCCDKRVKVVIPVFGGPRVFDLR